MTIKWADEDIKGKTKSKDMPAKDAQYFRTPLHTSEQALVWGCDPRTQKGLFRQIFPTNESKKEYFQAIDELLLLLKPRVQLNASVHSDLRVDTRSCALHLPSQNASV